MVEEEYKCPYCNSELDFYEGALGYEAFVCRNCGYFNDVNNKEGKDEVFISNKEEAGFKVNEEFAKHLFENGF